MKEFLQTLSNEQLDAIKSTNSILLTAIPGSGKTRSLINKIIFEYNESDSTYIFAITYTKRAAYEIEDRIQENLGYLPLNIWIGTIHKFCLEFIVRGYGSFSELFSKNFQVISEPDQEKIKSSLRKKYLINDPFLNIDYTLNINGEPNEKMYYSLVMEYYDRLFEINKIDFNYILYETYNMLANYPHIRSQLSTITKLICIDEYQDTQELQYRILGLICNENPKIGVFITGDVNQAIYEGIGGVTKTKDELNAIFNRKFEQRSLSGCYRSNQEIIDFYNKFSVEKMRMISKTDKWQNPHISIICDKPKSQVYEDIFSIIEESLRIGYKENDIAIVAPQWYQLYDITTEIKKKFPTIKLDAPDIVPLKKDDDGIIFKISKLLLTTFDYYNLYRIKQLANEVKIQFYDEYGIQLNTSIIDFLNLVKQSQTTDSKGTDFLKNSLLAFFTSIKLKEQFETDIMLFVEGTKERVEKFKEQGLEDEKIYFEQSLRSKTGIVISTCHGVKGEEYAIVIAFAMLEGYIPHWNDIINHKQFARNRSRKLLFVVFSRAKEKLFIFAENDRKTKKKNFMFINEDLKRVKTLYDNIIN